jgi:6-pyruvoyltetrahydropterin/6-carboxytetrahydropterin synthase
VTVKGNIDPKQGYLVDLKVLSEIITGNIIDKIDHRNINLEVDFMKGKMISTENLAISIWEQIEPHIRKLNVELHSVKVQETENNYAEYFGN